MPASSILLTFIAKRKMFSFQAIPQTQVIETEEESTHRAGKPACFIEHSRLCLTDHRPAIDMK